MKVKAYAYLRVSTTGQVKEGKDGLERQKRAIKRYAKKNKIEIVDWFVEKGISGAILNRPELVKMLSVPEKDRTGVTMVIVEKVDRIARDLMIQENILNDLKGMGLNCISCEEGDLNLLNNDPSRKLIRQIFGAIAEYDKEMTVMKLRVARERIRATGKKCEGRKSYKEISPDIIKFIRKQYKDKVIIYYIAKQLNDKVYTSLDGKKFNRDIINKIISNHINKRSTPP